MIRNVDHSGIVWSILLLLLLLAPSLNEARAAGHAARVLVAKGVVLGVDVEKRQRSLKRGSLLYSGETIITKNGQVQLRFRDRMLLTIYKNSRFAIDDYQFSDKKPGRPGQRANFTLKRGSIHALTGQIGKRTPKKFKMRTSFAILGVRGTDFMTQSRQKLHVSVLDGTVSLSNDAGTLLVGTGQNAFVNAVGLAPVLTRHRINMNSFREGGPVRASDQEKGDGPGGGDRRGDRRDDGGGRDDRQRPGDGGRNGNEAALPVPPPPLAGAVPRGGEKSGSHNQLGGPAGGAGPENRPPRQPPPPPPQGTAAPGLPLPGP